MGNVITVDRLQGRVLAHGTGYTRALARAFGGGGLHGTKAQSHGTARATTRGIGQGTIASLGGPLGWFSDWRNGTGQGSTATSDGGKWASFQGGGLVTQFSIVTSSSVGVGAFPMANVAKVNYPGNDNLNYQLISGIPVNSNTVPAPGQYWFLRFYYRYGLTDDQDIGEAHWFQCHDLQWELKHATGGLGSGTSVFRIVLNAQVNFDDMWNYLVNLPINTTYRVEISIHRLTTTTAKFFIRIYSLNGALLHDNNDFHTFNGPTDTLALRDPTMTVSDSSFTNFDMGNNDPDRSGVGSFWPGGFATRVSNLATDWIGPWTPNG